MNLNEKIFSNYWHLLCHRKEIHKNNDYLNLKTPLGDVVAFNDNGNIIVFDNLCPHRGSLIFQENFGNMPATCPYHGWTFKNNGVTVPSQDFFQIKTYREIV